MRCCLQKLPQLRLFPKADLIRAKKELVLRYSRALANGGSAGFEQRDEVNAYRGHRGDAHADETDGGHMGAVVPEAQANGVKHAGRALNEMDMR